ncbi:MAG: hypothetical protein EBU70_05780, partial [Actinobacteria bacterium]|nr:hypothetical protein [Actinomycetota bacterium]
IGGQRLSLSTKAAPGETLTALVRPESVAIIRGSEVRGIPCRVVGVSFGGPFVTVDVDAIHLGSTGAAGAAAQSSGHLRIRAIVGSREWQGFAVGDEVGVLLQDLSAAPTGSDCS